MTKGRIALARGNVLLCYDNVPAHVRYLDEPGELSQMRWRELRWRLPEKETQPCWWIVNASNEDRSQAPKFLARSVATLRLELAQNRIASSIKERILQYEKTLCVRFAYVEKERSRRFAKDELPILNLRNKQSLAP